MALKSSENRTYALGVFVGRFSPFHLGHLSVIERGLEDCDNMLIVLGSANSARRPDFIPFTVDERQEMILASLSDDQRKRIHCVGIEDHENTQDWISAVRTAAEDFLGSNGLDNRVALIGYSKDHSSYYLSLFPEWGAIEADNFKNISATPIRDTYFGQEGVESIGGMLVPDGVKAWLRNFSKTPHYRNMIIEDTHIRKTKSAWATAPYPPVFVTVDAVVIQSGYVLMVERGGRPGLGQIACPGGFIDQFERVEDGIFRELIEETKIKVPMKVLKRALVGTRYFDSPYRSSRGRTITFAGLIHLEPEVPTGEKNKQKIKSALALPKVRGSDDAKKAFWIPIADLQREKCFEDHFTIVMTMKALLKDNL